MARVRKTWCLWGISFVAILFASTTVICPALATVAEENAQLAAGFAARYESAKIAGLERKALSLAGKAAVRDGATLTIRPRSGRAQTYANSPSCDSADPVEITKCEAFILVSYARSRGAFVISDGKYEGGDWLLVDDISGSMQKLDDFPLFSPKGSRVLVLKNSDADGDKGIEIWSRANHRLKLDWSGSPSDSAAGTGRLYYCLDLWISESQLVVHSEAYENGSSAPHIQPLRLKFANNGWLIENTTDAVLADPACANP